MAKTAEIAPDYRNIFDTKLESFSRLMEQRIQVAEQIKALEEEKKDLDTELTGLMTDHDAPKVLYEGRSVSLVQGSRSTLNKEKLLLAGVPATTITAATDTTSYTYLLVGKGKV